VRYCSAFAGSYGLAATALRFTNVYGPFSYHKGSVVAHFMKRIMDGEPLVVYGDGSQTRDFLYVDDLCGAVLAVLLQKPVGELYQLGTGTETSVAELVDHPVELFPDAIDRPVRAGPRRWCAELPDISKAAAGPATSRWSGSPRSGPDRDWFVGAARMRSAGRARRPRNDRDRGGRGSAAPRRSRRGPEAGRPGAPRAPATATTRFRTRIPRSRS
jgi:hypothetical protein